MNVDFCVCIYNINIVHIITNYFDKGYNEDVNKNNEFSIDRLSDIEDEEIASEAITKKIKKCE